MSLKIAINGYGRIGRQVVRAIYEYGLRDQFEVVAINTGSDLPINAHLTKFDTVHGRFAAEVSHDETHLIVNGDKIRFLSQRDPSQLPWKELGVDLVMECTGKFTSKEKSSAHLQAGAKKVLISAPGGDDVGVGIAKGLMTTIHAFTNDQVLTDVGHKDLRRARSAVENMIPTKTGAAKAVGLVLPELKGKLDGFAVRVPTINVSLVDLTFEAGRDTSVEEINTLLKVASEGYLKGVLGYNIMPLVSSDFNHTTQASVFDSTLTKVSNGNMVKVLSWYDNEWGFSCQMLNTARAMFGMPVRPFE